MGSKQYFDKVAKQWDEMRESFFSKTSIHQSLISKRYSLSTLKDSASLCKASGHYRSKVSQSSNFICLSVDET